VWGSGWGEGRGEGGEGGGGGSSPHAGVPPLHPVPHPSGKRYIKINNEKRGCCQVIHPVWISMSFSVCVGLLLSLQLLPPEVQQSWQFWRGGKVAMAEMGGKTPQNIARLDDAAYQFCSEPEPRDWRQGSGVCFWFKKVGNEVVGMYGYPHSSRYVDCISGSIDRQAVTGQALAIATSGDDWPQLPQKGLTWDEEGHLQLGTGKIVHTERHQSGQLELIHFRTAVINLQGFYRYSAAKVKQMPTLPSSCDIPSWKRQTAKMLLLEAP
jgi:hypothetical protein